MRAISKAPLRCYNEYEALLFQAAYLLAHFGLFRVSELVYTNYQHCGRVMQLSDKKFEHGYKAVIVTIRHSKTNQSVPPESLSIPCEQDPGLCPVCALMRYSLIRSRTDGYLFQHQSVPLLQEASFQQFWPSVFYPPLFGTVKFYHIASA